jgi:type IV secretion system protein VirB1
MDVLTLAASCGPGVDPVTTAAIVKLESGYEPLVIRDNTLSLTLRPTSREAAGATVRELVKRGHKLAIGLMQVTTPWTDRLRVHPVELLDACTNVRIGTWILKQNYQACRTTRDPKAALECALSAYWTGNGQVGGAYVNAIYATSRSPFRIAETPGVTDGLLGSRQVRIVPRLSVGARPGFDFAKR